MWSTESQIVSFHFQFRQWCFFDFSSPALRLVLLFRGFEDSTTQTVRLYLSFLPAGRVNITLWVFVFVFPCLWHVKIPGIDLHCSSNPGCCKDNARYSTCFDPRELFNMMLCPNSVIFFCTFNPQLPLTHLFQWRLWHMGISWPGLSSCSCDQCHSYGNAGSFNSLAQVEDQIGNVTETRRIINSLRQCGNSCTFIFNSFIFYPTFALSCIFFAFYFL